MRKASRGRRDSHRVTPAMEARQLLHCAVKHLLPARPQVPHDRLHGRGAARTGDPREAADGRPVDLVVRVAEVPRDAEDQVLVERGAAPPRDLQQGQLRGAPDLGVPVRDPRRDGVGDSEVVRAGKVAEHADRLTPHAGAAVRGSGQHAGQRRGVALVSELGEHHHSRRAHLLDAVLQARRDGGDRRAISLRRHVNEGAKGRAPIPSHRVLQPQRHGVDRRLVVLPR
mmetsp:Transcript_91802/g.264782  ORF Transcript_91802/g.264782 Transcript_91802/m.264782 type:complete len:227 (+) Transcript_91802:606-1286(+)